MIATTLRYNEAERALRSTGEPPGVVIFACPEGHWSFAIDRGWDPMREPSGETVVTMYEDGISPTAEPLALKDAVEACVSDDDLRHLYMIACHAHRDALTMLLAAERFDLIRQLTDFVEELSGAAFRIRNPNASSSCGCGNSFAV